MTEQEKKEILELIEEHLAKQMPQREDTQSTLAKTRNKWFKDNDGSSYRSLMSKAINDTHGSYVIWESVRKITCKLCGVSYVRQIKDSDKANEIADKICQVIYDCAKEFNNA